MLKEKAQPVSGIVWAVDLGTIAISFMVAAIICRVIIHIQPLPRLRSAYPLGQDITHQYEMLILLSLIAWMGVTQWQETYRSHRAEHLWPLLLEQFTTQLLWVMLVGFFAFIVKLGLVSRAFFLTFLTLSMAMLTVRQLAARAFLRYVRSKGHNLRRVVVLGEPARAREFSRFIEADAGMGYRMEQLSPSPNGKLSGEPDVDFDEAFLMLGDEQTDLEATVIRLVKMGKQVHIVPGLFNATLFRQSLNEFAGAPVISVGGPGLDATEAAAKRFLDVVGSIMLFILFSPVLLLAALLVKSSSSGPIFFSQERLGIGGRRFRIYKFRTMFQDAEKRLHADPLLYQKYVENNFKLPKGEDPRVVRGGGFLRSTSIDEIPQLLNVLKGDMSLVGPRPIVPQEIEKYGDYGPLFLSVRPGLTGYWQINGRSEISDYSQRIGFDIEYIRDQSLRTDMYILLKTVFVVLRRAGAH